MKKNQMIKISMFTLLIAACSVGSSMPFMRRVAEKAMPKMGTCIGLMSACFVVKFSINQEDSIEFLQQRIKFLNQKLTKMQNTNMANIEEELKELQKRLVRAEEVEKIWDVIRKQNVESSQISANPLDTSLPAAMEQDTANQPAGVESGPKSE